MSTTVLLPWVTAMPWKMQSILLSGLRAPDVKTDATKRICRVMRSICQHNADPSKSYMEHQPLDRDLVDQCMDELEYLPCHYVHHFADALRVVSIYHPNDAVCEFAAKVHFEVAIKIFHFRPETNEQFILRHRDKVEHP